MRQCKAADALLLGRGLLGICTECAVDRLAERFFIRAACQVLLGRLRGDNAHIGPLIGFAAQIGRADRALFAFQIAEQLNRCACVQTEIVVNGQQTAQLTFGQRTACNALCCVTKAGEGLVIQTGTAQLIAGVARRFGGFVGCCFGFFRRRDQVVERECRTFVAVGAQTQGARCSGAVRAAVPQDIKIQQRRIAVADRNQLVEHVAACYAQFALGQQHRGHGLVLLSGGFWCIPHYSINPSSFEEGRIVRL